MNSVSYNLAPVLVIPDILLCCWSHYEKKSTNRQHSVAEERLFVKYIYLLDKECIRIS